MIRGLHAMFYSSNADELRAFLKDKLGLRGTDVGGVGLSSTFPKPTSEYIRPRRMSHRRERQTSHSTATTLR